MTRLICAAGAAFDHRKAPFGSVAGNRRVVSERVRDIAEIVGDRGGPGFGEGLGLAWSVGVADDGYPGEYVGGCVADQGALVVVGIEDSGRCPYPVGVRVSSGLDRDRHGR